MSLIYNEFIIHLSSVHDSLKFRIVPYGQPHGNSKEAYRSVPHTLCGSPRLSRHFSFISGL